MNPYVKGGIWVLALGLASYGGIWLYKQATIAMNYCYRISKLSVNRFSSSAIDLVVTVRFLNKSKLAATITGMNLDVFLNNKKLANVTKETSIKIEKSAVSQFDIPITVDPRQKFTFSEIAILAANYLSKVGQDKIKIRIVGNVTVSGIKIPLDITMSVKEMLEVDPNAPICPEKF